MSEGRNTELVSRLREIAMGRLKPDNGSSVPLADELRAAADALESMKCSKHEKTAPEGG